MVSSGTTCPWSFARCLFPLYHYERIAAIIQKGALRASEDITSAIEHHADTVVRVCALYFGHRPESDDAFQDTFLKYAQSDKAFESEEHRKAWLISVATNTCKDMLRKAEAHTVLTDQFDDTASPQWQSGVESDDRIDALNEALQKLDEKYRIVLYLKYYEGYTAPEIAEMLAMPESTVYTNLTRGRDKLKEVLARG